MPGYPPISDELRELLSLLNSPGVEFLVVGAAADGQVVIESEPCEMKSSLVQKRFERGSSHILTD